MRVLIKLLQLKFNSIAERYVQQLETTDQETLLSLAEKILEANTIEDVFV